MERKAIGNNRDKTNLLLWKKSGVPQLAEDLTIGILIKVRSESPSGSRWFKSSLRT